MHAAAPGRAHDHWEVGIAVRAIGPARSFAAKLVEAAVDEVGELDLRDGPHAVMRGANADPDDPGLREWRIDEPIGVLRLEPFRRPEYAARLDVLAEDE